MEVLLGDIPERNARRRGAGQWALRYGGDEPGWGELADRVLRRAHALLAHPEVAEAIVIGLPDADLGARVHAIVRPEAGKAPGEGELIAFAAGRLVAYKLPRSIEFTQAALRDEAGKARRSQRRAERLAGSEEENAQ